MALRYTRLHQSGFVLETPLGARLAFDIGMATDVREAEDIAADLHFITHMHGDHFNTDNVRAIGAPVVAPPDVIGQLAGMQVRTFAVEAGRQFSFADAHVTGFAVDHGPITTTICNFGYHIVVGDRSIFFMGDMKIDSIPYFAYDTLLIPVGGNKVFTASEAHDYIRRIGFAGTIVPIHTEMAAEDGALDTFRDLVGNGLRVLAVDVGSTVNL